MKYGYARVSTDGQSVTAQVAELTKAGCAKVFRETASGAQTNRAQLRKAHCRLFEDCLSCRRNLVIGCRQDVRTKCGSGSPQRALHNQHEEGWSNHYLSSLRS